MADTGSGWEEWTDPVTRAHYFRVRISEFDAHRLTKERLDMLARGATLVMAAFELEEDELCR